MRVAQPPGIGDVRGGRGRVEDLRPICDQLPGELFGRGLVSAVSPRGPASVVVMPAPIPRAPPVTMAARRSMRSIVGSLKAVTGQVYRGSEIRVDLVIADEPAPKPHDVGGRDGRLSAVMVGD